MPKFQIKAIWSASVALRYIDRHVTTFLSLQERQLVWYILMERSTIYDGSYVRPLARSTKQPSTTMHLS